MLGVINIFNDVNDAKDINHDQNDRVAAACADELLG